MLSQLCLSFHMWYNIILLHLLLGLFAQNMFGTCISEYIASAIFFPVFLLLYFVSFTLLSVELVFQHSQPHNRKICFVAAVVVFHRENVDYFYSVEKYTNISQTILLTYFNHQFLLEK